MSPATPLFLKNWAFIQGIWSAQDFEEYRLDVGPLGYGAIGSFFV
jgi:hypothetical protein